MVKTNNRAHMTFEELKERISNKSVFDEKEISSRYHNDRNLVAIEMLYYGFFGVGHNVNNAWLVDHGLWASKNEYPANIQLNSAQFKTIIGEGNIDVSNVIID